MLPCRPTDLQSGCYDRRPQRDGTVARCYTTRVVPVALAVAVCSSWRVRVVAAGARGVDPQGDDRVPARGHEAGTAGRRLPYDGRRRVDTYRTKTGAPALQLRKGTNGRKVVALTSPGSDVGYRADPHTSSEQ